MRGMLVLLALFGLSAAGIVLPSADEATEISADVYAPDMLFSHRQALTYATAMPAVRGIIPAAAIVAASPADFAPRLAWTTRIDSNPDGSRRITTMPASPLPFPAAALAMALSAKSGGYPGAGMALGGLVRTARGSSTMSVPASVPDGYPVIVTNLN